MPPPGSFHEDNWSDWETWVLDHGLPEPPPALAVDEAVPIAVWTGGGWAAVLTVSYVGPDPECGEPASLDTECQTFRWSEGRWDLLEEHVAADA